jgi:geranylgeranyl reductase family protein
VVHFEVEFTMETKYDVVIVGGSCAGAAAGYMLARVGKKVIIIDKAVFPRKKLCGGMITEKTVNLLAHVYPNIRQEDYVDSSYSAFGIFDAVGGKICKYSHPTKKVYFVDRSVFDDVLLNQAATAGCDVICGQRVVRVIGKSVITDSGLHVSGEFIVGADGANSVVRPLLASSYNRKDYSIGLEIDASYDELKCFDSRDKSYPRIYFGYINYGYGWVFPKKSVVTVGLGGPLRQNEQNARELFRIFLKAVSNDAALLLDKISAFPVPFHNLILKPARVNVFLAGDAAGLVEPVTGEGIYFAILSGTYVAEALTNGGEAAERYNSLIRTKIHPILRQARLMKKIYFNRYILRYAMYKMQRNAKYCKYYLDLLSGDIDYVQYIAAVLRDRGKYPSA